jgi:hypothetical protein
VGSATEQDIGQDTGTGNGAEEQAQTPTKSVTLATLPPDEGARGSIEVFASHESFRAAARMANALSQSTVVPKEYQGNVANCLVAMELATRTKASVLMVMQNLGIINGRPGWSAAFLIASVNTSGRFSALRYQTEGGDDPHKETYKVRAYATELATGEKLFGEWISWAIVKAEGWLGRSGSKWKTMPGQMFRYRAASFWTRAFAPEISLGMHTSDEVADFNGETPNGASAHTTSLNEAIKRERAGETVVDAEVVGETAKPTAAEIEAQIRREDLELQQEEAKQDDTKKRR